MQAKFQADVISPITFSSAIASSMLVMTAYRHAFGGVVIRSRIFSCAGRNLPFGSLISQQIAASRQNTSLRIHAEKMKSGVPGVFVARLSERE